MPAITLRRTTDLDVATPAVIWGLLDEAFDGNVVEADRAHALGGTHALVHDGGRLVGHGSVVPRQLWHGPGWVPRPEFERDVEAMLASGRWVTEYQYRPVKPRLLERAEAVVWLDHPFPLVAARLLRGRRSGR